MARRTRTFLITAVAGAAALIPAAGASAGTLDQQQTLVTFGGLQVDSTNSKAQTFTAGLTGQLDQVDLALSGLSLTTPLTVQIRDGSATAPGATVLASASVPTSAVTGSASFVPATFTSTASVTAGTQYSIVALTQRQFQLVLVRGGAGNRFALCGREVLRQLGRPPGDGHLDQGNPQADFAFKTYVAPPPPPPPGGGSGGGSTGAAPATGERAAALKKCKKKRSQTAKKKCRKKAKTKPV